MSLFLAFSAAHAELRHVERCDSERLSFFVDTSGDQPRLVYKFDGTLMGEVPDFNIDWSWHTNQPEKAIYDVQYADGGWLFIVYQQGRIAVGEALYQCEYPSGRMKSRRTDLDAFCEALRKDARMSTYPRSSNRSGYAFLAWIDHDTFLWEVRTESTTYHVYARFPEGARFDDATQKITPLKIIEYDRGE